MKNVSKMLAGHRASIDRLVLRLEQQGEGMSQIEIDLLLSELRLFYADLLSLESAPIQHEEAIPATEEVVAPATEPQAPAMEPDLVPLMVEPEAEPVYAEEPVTQQEELPSVPQPTMEELEGQPNEALFEEGPEPEPEPIPEPTPEPEPLPEPEPIKEPEPKVEMPQREHVPETEQPHQQPSATKQQPSLFDYLKGGNTQGPAQRTIADTLGEAQQRRIEERANPNKVQDLRTIININDKFSFMNELFHNNMKGYNDFILHLNATTDRDEALAYVQQVAQQQAWDNESLAVKTFYNVFDRKF